MTLKEQVLTLAQPEDYFSGLSWTGHLLPEEILAFKRVRQDHATSGWEGISAKAGRYDQHRRFVFLMPIDGEGKLGVESEVWPVKEGEALLLFPHQIHYYVEVPEFFCWLFITFELRPEDVLKVEKLRGGPRQLRPGLEKAVASFLDLYQKENGLGASAALAHVLAELAHGVQVQRPNEEVVERGIIGRVKRYVMGNLEGELSNPQLAEQMRVSESYLRAVFRDETGVSLGHFVRSARLVRASYLLEEGKLGVNDIATCCGFQSVASFTRAFRRTYEMTPSSYRKRLQD